jgi:hypothetical protein
MEVFLVAAAVGGTLYAFVSGISAMAVDGQVGRHSSVEWMAMRVGFQALAVAAVLLALLAA